MHRIRMVVVCGWWGVGTGRPMGGWGGATAFMWLAEDIRRRNPDDAGGPPLGAVGLGSGDQAGDRGCGGCGGMTTSRFATTPAVPFVTKLLVLLAPLVMLLLLPPLVGLPRWC